MRTLKRRCVLLAVVLSLVLGLSLVLWGVGGRSSAEMESAPTVAVIEFPSPTAETATQVPPTSVVSATLVPPTPTSELEPIPSVYEVVVTEEVPGSDHLTVNVAEVERFMADFGFPAGAKIRIHWLEPYGPARERHGECFFTLAFAACPCDKEKDEAVVHLCDGNPLSAVIGLRPEVPDVESRFYRESIAHELWHTKQCLVDGADFSLIDWAMAGLKSGELTEEDVAWVAELVGQWEDDAFQNQFIIADQYSFFAEEAVAGTVDSTRIHILGSPPLEHIPTAEQVLAAFRAVGLAPPEGGLIICVVGPDYADPCPGASCGLTCWVAPEKGWLCDPSGTCLSSEGCNIVLRLHSSRCGGAPMSVVLANELAHVACDLAPKEGCVGNAVWSPYFEGLCVALGGDPRICKEWGRR